MGEAPLISGYHIYRYDGKEVKVRVSASTGEEIQEDRPEDLPLDAVGSCVPLDAAPLPNREQMMSAYQAIVSRDPDFVPPPGLLQSFGRWQSVSFWIQNTNFTKTDVVAFGENHSSLFVKKALIEEILPGLKAKGFEYFVTELFPLSIQPEVDEFMKTGKVGEQMKVFLKGQDNFAKGLSGTYLLLLRNVRKLGLKIIAAGPDNLPDVEKLFYQRMGEAIPARVDQYKRENGGIAPSMEIGEAWAAEILEQVRAERIRPVTLATDASIVEALKAIPPHKKAVLLCGYNHVVRQGGSPVVAASGKRVTTVLLFDVPLEIRGGLIGSNPPSALPEMGLMLKVEKQLQGALIQTDPHDLYPTVRYPDSKVLDWAVVLNY